MLCEPPKTDPKLTATPTPKKPPGTPSAELVAKLKALTPAQREQVIAMAAQLLAKKAHRPKS